MIVVKKMIKPKIVGVIPARYKSTRLPGKMLCDILGKSLIQRTYENTRSHPLFDSVVVATDEKLIFDHVRGFGGEVVMTSSSCLTGTDRVAEAVEKHYADADIVVNVQGDEPLLGQGVVEGIVGLLLSKEDAVMSTAATPITDLRELSDSSVVKCVFDVNGKALYFSRSPLPFGHKEGDEIAGYYRHLGVYGFKAPFLRQFASLKQTPLQKAEGLEQLKVLEHGYSIHVCVVQDDGVGVDTPEDLKRIEKRLCQKNTSLSQAALSHP